ncbi:MAG: IPExxxVDY family protein [Flavobacteriales bacterium]|nr:IPExxxVDY family protein [Flavobacteriales bacterium]
MLLRLDKDEFLPPVDFGLICICCTMREYRLAHLINQNLHFDLARDGDLNAEDDMSTLPVYSRFRWEDVLAHRSTFLYGNRPLNRQEVTRPGDLFSSEETALLIPDLPKADYLLQLIGDFDASDIEHIRGSLHSIPGITLAFITDPSKIKNIEPILI